MIHRISTRLALAVCAFLFFHSTSLVGQTFRGAINGTVIDPSGAAVPNAQVQVIEIGTSAGRNTITTADGEFSMQDLPLGTYKIAVTAPGFAFYTEAGIVVEAGSVRSLAIKLSLAQETGSLEVSAAALTVDTTSSTQSDSIPDQAVQNMPLNGRDFTQLIAIAPGYGGYSINGGGTINGARNNGVDWQVDGTDNNDFWYDIPAINQGGVSGIAGVVMPIDAIDEFSTQTEANAENGRDAGGTVNVVLMSGTNQFHGTAYYYNRNEAFAAHSPFFVPSPDFPKAPRLRNENYGFTVGGPIIKNKTFFFFGFETQNYIFGLTGLATEPSSAWIQNAQALLTQYGVPQSTLSYQLVFESVAEFDQQPSRQRQQLFCERPRDGLQLQRHREARPQFQQQAPLVRTCVSRPRRSNPAAWRGLGARRGELQPWLLFRGRAAARGELFRGFEFPVSAHCEQSASGWSQLFRSVISRRQQQL